MKNHSKTILFSLGITGLAVASFVIGITLGHYMFVESLLVLFTAFIMIIICSRIFSIFISRRTENTSAVSKKRISGTVNLLISGKDGFGAVFSEAPIGMALIDSHTGNICEVNQAFAEIVDNTVEEVTNIDWRTIIHPDDIQEVENKMSLIYRDKLPGVKVEERFLHPDGSHIWADMKISPVMLGEKETLYYLCMVLNITEHKKLEKFPEENPAPVMRADKNGLLIYANNSSMPLLADWKAEVNSKLPDIWCERIKTVLEQNEIMAYEVQYGQVCLSLSFCPIKEMNYVNIYGYDITESKRLEKFPHENPAPVMRTNEAGLLIYANNSSMPLLDYWKTEVNSRLPEIWRKRVAAVLEQNKIIAHEVRYGQVYLSLSLCPIKEMNYVNIYGYDITDSKRAQKELLEYQAHLQRIVDDKTRELKQSNEYLKSFTYSVSHDLRAPLRALDGFSQVLQEDYEDKLDEEGQDYLRRIRNATIKMGSLIDSLLKLFRISQVQMKTDEVNLSNIAESIIARYREYAPERKCDFIVKPDMIVNGDSNLLEITLENLLGNAWKFTRKKKVAQIEFSFEEDAKKRERVYYIKDNGAGFNMAYADKLFGAFQRLHTMEEFEGSGIGLATVSQIIKRHRGRIWAESVENEGTVFYFTLNL